MGKSKMPAKMSMTPWKRKLAMASVKRVMMGKGRKMGRSPKPPKGTTVGQVHEL